MILTLLSGNGEFMSNEVNETVLIGKDYNAIVQVLSKINVIVTFYGEACL